MSDLTSRIQHGDAVILNYGEAGVLRNCYIEAIKFSEKKVKYDVKVIISMNEPDNYEIIEDVDSCFVEFPTDRFTGLSLHPYNFE
jgi:hypothetical protein